MNTILHIIKKEFLQFRRDRRMFAISFIAPVFQLIMLGYAANLDVRNIPTAVCDLDNSRISREFVAEFSNSGYFDLRYFVDEMEHIDGLIDNGEVALAIVIPNDFGNELTADKSPQLQIIADGSDANTGTIGLNYASMIVSEYSGDILMKTLERRTGIGNAPKPVKAEIRVWYNPELKSRNFMIPGVLALLLMVITLILTSLAIVKEKEIGTMEQLIVTPIKPYQLIVGKLTPFTLIGLVDIALVLLVATLWFGVPVRGSVFLLFFLCAVFLLTTLGLGLLVSTVSRNQQQAMMTSIFFIMLPMIYFSGFVFPIPNMPPIFQYFSYLLPLRYFFVIIRGIFLKGVGIAELWDQALILLFFGFGILSLAVMRFQKRLE